MHDDPKPLQPSTNRAFASAAFHAAEDADRRARSSIRWATVSIVASATALLAQLVPLIWR